jgi:hypothetical protein
MRTSIWRDGEFLTLVVLAALVIVVDRPGAPMPRERGQPS